MFLAREEIESRIETRITRSLRKTNGQKKKKIYKGEVFLTELRNKLKDSEFGYFESTQGNNSATNLSG